MGVSRQHFECIREFHPTLRVIRECPHSGEIDAVSVQMLGRRGGRTGWWLWSPNARQTYEVVLDTSNIANVIPDAWIISPTDGEIRHLNVFHNQECRLLGRSLPRVCWWDFATEWARARPEQRTLGAVLEYLNQLLNHQNPSSAARI
jgi:hypothetical protein